MPKAKEDKSVIERAYKGDLIDMYIERFLNNTLPLEELTTHLQNLGVDEERMKLMLRVVQEQEEFYDRSNTRWRGFGHAEEVDPEEAYPQGSMGRMLQISPFKWGPPQMKTAGPAGRRLARDIKRARGSYVPTLDRKKKTSK
jgi:hypothetical protein